MVLVCAAFHCTSCTAPIADLRPPNALVHDDRMFEAGAGAAMVRPRPYVIEDAHGEGQFWITGRVASWLNVSGVGAFDAHTGKGGVAALARYLTTDRFVAGVGAEAGYAWIAGSLSGAVRLFDDTWLYTAPRVSNWGQFVNPGIPVGVSAKIYEGLSLRAEAQLSWEDLKYYNRRLHLAAAAVYAW